MPKKNQSSSKNHRPLALLFFFSTRIIALILSFPCITDVPSYLDHFVKGQIFDMKAYSGFAYEYPPLSLVPIYFSGIFSRNILSFESYYIGFASLMFLADFCCLNLCQFYCRKRLQMKESEVNYMILLYSLFGFLLFKILYHRLDIIVTLLLTASLLLFDAKNSKLKIGFFLNSLAGFFYKIVPAFTMPCAIIFKAFQRYNDQQKVIKKIIFDSVAFVLSLATIIFSWEIYTNHHFIQNMLFHQKRGIQLESSYASILLFINLLSGKVSQIVPANGGWDVLTNFYLEIFAKNFGNLVLIGFYCGLFFVLLKQRNSSKRIIISEENFLEVSLIVILLTLSFQRVLSTQFFIWLIPLSSIWLAKNRSIKFLLIFAFLFFATFAIFSLDYFALVNEAPLMVIALFLRNLTLVTLSCFMSINFFKKLSDNEQTRSNC